MFKSIRALTDAIQTMNVAILAALKAQEAKGPSEDRLADLEISRATWEAEMEGVLMKAEGKLKAANNAESRTRTMVKHYEKDADPFGEDSDAPEVQGTLDLPPEHVQFGGEEGVYPLQENLASHDGKAIALRAKFM